MPAHRRYEILSRAAELIRERREEFARTIATEAGKALKYARIEVDRGIGTFTFAAEEAKRMHGETVPLDAIPSGEGYFGYYVRRPVGVIVGISPFNFPLNLVATRWPGRRRQHDGASNRPADAGHRSVRQVLDGGRAAPGALT
jgi:acyl-CoA reductase-like NAD-dependent aldehyde dehydrogenase